MESAGTTMSVFLFKKKQYIWAKYWNMDQKTIMPNECYATCYGHCRFTRCGSYKFTVHSTEGMTPPITIVVDREAGSCFYP